MHTIVSCAFCGNEGRAALLPRDAGKLEFALPRYWEWAQTTPESEERNMLCGACSERFAAEADELERLRQGDTP